MDAELKEVAPLSKPGTHISWLTPEALRGYLFASRCWGRRAACTHRLLRGAAPVRAAGAGAASLPGQPPRPGHCSLKSGGPGSERRAPGMAAVVTSVDPLPGRSSITAQVAPSVQQAELLRARGSLTGRETVPVDSSVLNPTPTPASRPLKSGPCWRPPATQGCCDVRSRVESAKARGGRPASA